MKPRVARRTVDLSGYLNLVVIYLGMRVNALTGLKTLFGFGPRIRKSVEAHPDVFCAQSRASAGRTL